MGSEWPTKSLKECGTWRSGGTPSRGNPEYWNGLIPWISAKSLKEFFVETSDDKITELGLENGSRLVPKDSILFVVRGMSLKTEFRMGVSMRPVAFNQDLRALEPNDDILPYFLAYAMKGKTNEILGLVGEAGHGTGTLPTDRIQEVQIPDISIQEQRKIVHVLRSLDDKIELNRQMNATLEGMAQALFKSWFVDFDPVIDNAIAAGNPIPEELADRADVRRAALADGTANREAAKPFPAGFQHTEELGWIPEGWEAAVFGDIAIFKNGKKSPDRNDGGVPVFGSNGQIGFCQEHNREDVIVIGRVGTYCGSLHYCRSRCWATDNAMTAEMHNKANNTFLLRLLEFAALNTRRGGSGQPLLNQTILSSIPFPKPTDDLIIQHARFCSTHYEKIEFNNIIVGNLTKLRDTLLPKLISGELRIPDAEKLAEEALA